MGSRGKARAEETIYNSFSSTEVSHGDHMVSIPTEESRKENDQRRDVSASHQKGLLNYFSIPDYAQPEAN